MLSIVGGAALIWLGWVAMTGKPPEKAADAPISRSLWTTFASTFFLTMANPATILTFAAIFAGLGLAAVDTADGAAVLVVVILNGTCQRRYSASSGVSSSKVDQLTSPASSCTRNRK